MNIPDPDLKTVSRLDNLIPRPAEIKAGKGISCLTPEVVIDFDPEDQSLVFIAGYLRDSLEFSMDGKPRVDQISRIEKIKFQLKDNQSAFSAEDYQLKIKNDQIILVSTSAQGIFRGVQTLLQLIELSPQGSPVISLPQCEMMDSPRYSWRGIMLDVARHFFPPADIKRVIDLMARYKLNILHLHLTDDQGWRIEINSWPELTAIGGQTEVGGGKGGYFSQEEYADLVLYAQDRYITLVPEIDMPGHTNAALASYPELSKANAVPDLYTGIEVGFSSLEIDNPLTYNFINDVIRELTSLTPGPYIHIGGDEAKSTKLEDYRLFIEKVQGIVNQNGKIMIGWQEIAQSSLTPGSIVQYWTDDSEMSILPDGVNLIMSPAKRAYLDMKYDQDCQLGLNWAGYVNLEDAYSWDPETYLEAVQPDSILGLEAPLWSETLETIADIEYMMFPRLLAYSEIAWSTNTKKDFQDFQKRVANQRNLFEKQRVNYYRSKLVDWDQD